MHTEPSTQPNDFDLASEELDEAPWDPAPGAVRSALVQRLEQYRILPPAWDRMPTRALEQIEQLFVTWFELQDDGSRRAALSYVFSTEDDARAALLAIVPIYYDALFFDERTPTRDLVEIALVAHAKWRRWLTSSDGQAA